MLGTELKKLSPHSLFPGTSDFDVVDYQKMSKYLDNREVDTILHAGAFTSPPLIDESPEKALNVNIIGTSNLVQLCSKKNIRLIYMSTDYVFEGSKGNYKEGDEIKPTNKYAWSKLGGECAVRLYDNSLIIRTSFGPNEFPYPKAFTDQWTSRQSVRDISVKVMQVVQSDVTGIIHLGGKRQTVHEYAKSLDESKDVGGLSLKDVAFTAPEDTSLDCSYYMSLFGTPK